MSVTQDRLFTVDDYMGLDDGKRYQVVSGELIVSPAPSDRHQEIVTGLATVLRNHVREQRLGIVRVAPFDVVLGPHDVVQPDVLYLSHEDAGAVDQRNCKGPPTLVIEVLSPSTRRLDLVRKQALYARCGVRHLWYVEQKPLAIRELALDGVHYQEIANVTDGTFHPLCPAGLSFRLEDLLDG